MKFSYVRNLLMATVGVFLLVFLIIKSQNIDFNRHNDYVIGLRQLSELDAKLNEDILQLRDGLLNYYDSIVDKLNNLQTLQNRLEKTPAFIGQQGQREINHKLQAHEALLHHKEELIEEFKSQNAVLRNSLSYFPIAVTNLVDEASKEVSNSQGITYLNTILKDVLIYNLSPNEELIPAINNQIKIILESRGQFSSSFNNSDLDIAIAHTQIILEYKPQVDRLVRKLIALPTEQHSLALASAYIVYYQRTLKTTNFFRLLLYIYSIFLLSSISAYIIHQLRKSAAIIQQAEEKYRSIFENSVEGIYQIAPDGYYLSANPSLAQIYGYASPEELRASITDIQHQLYVQPNRRSKFLRLIEEQGAVSNFEFQVYRKDRSIIWISETARAVREHQGSLLYYEGTVADITARKQAEEALRLEQEKSELLLLNILPKPIADRLKRNPQSIADSFAEATVLFSDIVGFTNISARISPTELVNLLNQIFSAFDRLAEKHGLEKIKTIGDAYMVVGGVPVPRPDHAEAVANMALDMQSEIARFNAANNQSVNIRIGINTGPVVAGVIGIKKFTYDLWGDAVNTASRMESHGIPGYIQVTEATYKRLQNQYQFEARGIIPVKGKGEMFTYFLTSRNRR